MDAPRKRRFRFGLKAILGLVALCGALLGILARRTDPLLARKGMTKAEIWWKCGGPDFVLEFLPDHWGYRRKIPQIEVNAIDVNVLFEDGEVVDAFYVLQTDRQEVPEMYPLPYVPETHFGKYSGKDVAPPPRTE